MAAVLVGKWDSMKADRKVAMLVVELDSLWVGLMAAPWVVSRVGTWAALRVGVTVGGKEKMMVGARVVQWVEWTAATKAA